MGGRLKGNVTIDGVLYEAGTEVSDDIASLIHNPKLLDGSSPPVEEATDGWSSSALTPSEVQDVRRMLKAWHDSEAADGDPEPPRAGPGSGAPKWVAYARSIGIDVADDAARDDVIALVDAQK